MENTVIQYCPSCAHNEIKHNFQDIKYGRFVRVFNVNIEKDIATCTVCGNKKTKK